MKNVHLFLVFFVTSFSILVQAQEESQNKPTLICWLHNSDSLYIYPETEVILHTPFVSNSTQLVGVSFTHLRCPYCYEFSGLVKEQYYKGETKSYFDSTSHNWQVILDLKIDGKQEEAMPCTVLNRN